MTEKRISEEGEVREFMERISEVGKMEEGSGLGDAYRGLCERVAGIKMDGLRDRELRSLRDDKERELREMETGAQYARKVHCTKEWGDDEEYMRDRDRKIGGQGNRVGSSVLEWYRLMEEVKRVRGECREEFREYVRVLVEVDRWEEQEVAVALGIGRVMVSQIKSGKQAMGVRWMEEGLRKLEEYRMKKKLVEGTGWMKVEYGK